MKKLNKVEFQHRKEKLSKQLNNYIKASKHIINGASFVGLEYKGHIFKIKNRYDEVSKDDYVRLKELNMNEIKELLEKGVPNIMLSIDDISFNGKVLIDEFLESEKEQ